MSSPADSERPDIDRLIANVVRASSKVQWCRARWESDEQASKEEAAAVAALRAAFAKDAAAAAPASKRMERPAGAPATGAEQALEVRCEGSQLLEVVGRGQVHLEQMSNNHWWMVLEAGGQRVDVWLHASGRITATFETDEAPQPSPAG